VFYVLEQGDETTVTLGPEGGVAHLDGLEVRVPRGAFARATRVRLSSQPDDAAEMYARVSESGSQVFRVEASQPLRKHAELRFRMERGRDSERLVAATRSGTGEGWGLLEGQGQEEGLSVRVPRFSFFEARELRADVGGVRGVLGGRVKRPACPQQTASGAKVTVDAPEEDPRLFACPVDLDGATGLRIVNNRAAPLEFDLPEGVAVRSVKGRSISETVWEKLNVLPGSGNGRLVPSENGEVVLTGDFPEEGLDFRVTSAALTYDALLGAVAAAGTEGQRLLAQGGEALECLRQGVSETRGSLDSFDSLLGRLRDILADCAGALPAKVLVAIGKTLGTVQLLNKSWDVLQDLGDRPTTVSMITPSPVRLPEVRPQREVEAPRRIRVAEDGTILDLGGFRPQQYLGTKSPGQGVTPTLGNAVKAFGAPASRVAGEPDGPGCLTQWPKLALRAESEDFGASNRPCANRAGVQHFTVIGTGAKQWATDRGLRVGDDVETLEELYPEAEVDQQQEHTYRLIEEPSPIGDEGRVERLSAGVYDGRVVSLIVSPYGAGE